MSRLLVTGATGCLGSVLVRRAVAVGHRVRALLLPDDDPGPIADLDIEVVRGDVTRRESLDGAMEDVDACIHTAGNTSFYRNDRRALEAVNVGGVRNVVAAVRAAHVPKLVHTSSVATIGYDPGGGPVDETATWNWPRGIGYMETKREGERIVLEAAGETLRVVALNPGTIYGPSRLNPNDEELIAAIRDGKVPGVPAGGMTLCDVEDVADAHLAALERGTSGERYILGGPYATHAQLFRSMAEALGVAPPTRRVPSWVLRLGGGFFGAVERLGLRGPAPAAALRLSTLHLYHSSDRAVAELGYRTRTLQEIVERTVGHRLQSN